MAGSNVLRTAVGFAATLVVLGLLLYAVGVEDLLSKLARADLRLVAAVVLAAVAWLVAWSLSLRTVLGVLGVPMSPLKSFLVFAGAMFSNNVTPFGQAGGEPVTALLISRVTDAEYETGLASIASVDTLNFAPSITLALVGAGYYATEIAFGGNRNLLLAVGAVVVLAVVVPTGIYLGWQRRYRLEDRVVSALTPIIQRITDWLPRVPVPTAASIERRINGFFRAIERIGADPEGLALALAFSTVGWLFQILGLWLAFQAIGVPINLSVALFAVPVGAIAGATPLPGGAGGIEWVLATLLAAVTGPAVGFSTATAAVVIFRGAVYWVPTIVGGVVTGVVGSRG
jgi:hypothetical protein